MEAFSIADTSISFYPFILKFQVYVSDKKPVSYTHLPPSIFTFVREAGISKSDNLIDMRQLEACIRSELDLTAQRRIAVLDPVKLVVDNYPADKTEYFDIANNPNREANDTTTRKVAFTRELWIENEDFAEVPPPKFKRLTVGGEVRLMGGYRCV